MSIQDRIVRKAEAIKEQQERLTKDIKPHVQSLAQELKPGEEQNKKVKEIKENILDDFSKKLEKLYLSKYEKEREIQNIEKSVSDTYNDTKQRVTNEIGKLDKNKIKDTFKRLSNAYQAMKAPTEATPNNNTEGGDEVKAPQEQTNTYSKYV